MRSATCLLLLLMLLLPALPQGEKPAADAQGRYAANSTWPWFRVKTAYGVALDGRNEPKESGDAIVSVPSGYLLKGKLVPGEGQAWLRCEMEGSVVYFPAREDVLKAAESGPGVRDNGDFYKKFRDFHAWYEVTADELNARRSAKGALDMSSERDWPPLDIWDWPVYTTYKRGSLVEAVGLVSDARGQNWFVVEGRPNRWQMMVRANQKFLKPVAGPPLRWLY